MFKMFITVLLNPNAVFYSSVYTECFNHFIFVQPCFYIVLQIQVCLNNLAMVPDF